jgi:hypothetical protein
MFEELWSSLPPGMEEATNKGALLILDNMDENPDSETAQAWEAGSEATVSMAKTVIHMATHLEVPPAWLLYGLVMAMTCEIAEVEDEEDMSPEASMMMIATLATLRAYEIRNPDESIAHFFAEMDEGGYS